jgi:hypothetical protein
LRLFSPGKIIAFFASENGVGFIPGAEKRVVRSYNPPILLSHYMPRRPASLTQADIARVIRAAKQAGATEVVIKVGEQSLIVRLAPSTGADMPLAPAEEIPL